MRSRECPPSPALSVDTSAVDVDEEDKAVEDGRMVTAIAVDEIDTACDDCAVKDGEIIVAVRSDVGV